MDGGAAQEQTMDGSAAVAPHGTELVDPHGALQDVPARQAVGSLQIERAEDLDRRLTSRRASAVRESVLRAEAAEADQPDEPDEPPQPDEPKA